MTALFFQGFEGSYIGEPAPITIEQPTMQENGTGGFVFGSFTPERWYWLNISAPEGEDLHVGEYTAAKRFRGVGQPQLDLSGDGRGCNQVEGAFVVDEITRSGDGTLATFSARFEMICEGIFAPVFGAISYNSTKEFRSRTLPGKPVNLGAVAYGAVVRHTETISNAGPAPLHITGIKLDGPEAGRWAIVANNCPATLAAGASCTFGVELQASTVVGRNAVDLVITDDMARAEWGGRRVEVVAWVQPRPVTEGEFTALTPSRILDTRRGIGAPQARLGAGQTIDVQVTGLAGVPSTGVSAVVFNATAVGGSSSTYFTIWPTGAARREISNLNVTAGEVRPNLVTVAVGTGGKVSLFNERGNVDAIFDIVGYYSSADGPAGARFRPLDPARLFDTRNGIDGAPPKPLAAGETLDIDIDGRAWVPHGTARAVVMNVTATSPTGAGYLTVYPGDVARPEASNLNFTVGQTVPNLVVVRVPADGHIRFFNFGGSTHVVADVVGYYDDAKLDGSGRFIAVPPSRLVDTRSLGAPLGPDEYGVLTVAGNGGVPGDAAAAVLNFTATAATTSSFVTVFPDDVCEIPLASNLNFGAGDTVPNLVMVRLSGHRSNCQVGDGRVDVYNFAGEVHIIADVFGYFTSTSAPNVRANAVPNAGPQGSLTTCAATDARFVSCNPGQATPVDETWQAGRPAK